MSDDQYKDYPNVVDFHAWKKQKDVEDEEDLKESLGYFRQLLRDIVDDMGLGDSTYRTFHIPLGDQLLSGSSFLELEQWDPMGDDDETT